MVGVTFIFLAFAGAALCYRLLPQLPFLRPIPMNIPADVTGIPTVASVDYLQPDYVPCVQLFTNNWFFIVPLSLYPKHNTLWGFRGLAVLFMSRV